MAKARDCQLWDQTAGLAAFILNGIFGSQIDPKSIHPHHANRDAGPDVSLGGKEGIQFLKRFYGRAGRK